MCHLINSSLQQCVVAVCLAVSYRAECQVFPFTTQHTPFFSVSPSSCQRFSRLKNDSHLCDSTTKASTFLTRQQLQSLDPGAKPCHLDPIFLSHLKDLGIPHNLPRKRSKRGGRRKQWRIPVLITSRKGCSFVPSSRRHADSHPSPCFLSHISLDSTAAAATSKDGSFVFQECLETYPSAPGISGASSHRASSRGTQQCNSKTDTHSSNLTLIQIDTSPRADDVSHFSRSPTLWWPASMPSPVKTKRHTELKCSPFKAWSRSVYSHTCYAYCPRFLPCSFLPFWSIHLHFVQNLSRFFLCWLWLTHGSCVGPQNKIGHLAGGRFPC